MENFCFCRRSSNNAGIGSDITSRVIARKTFIVSALTVGTSVWATETQHRLGLELSAIGSAHCYNSLPAIGNKRIRFSSWSFKSNARDFASVGKEKFGSLKMFATAAAAAVCSCGKMTRKRTQANANSFLLLFLLIVFSCFPAPVPALPTASEHRRLTRHQRLSDADTVLERRLEDGDGNAAADRDSVASNYYNVTSDWGDMMQGDRAPHSAQRKPNFDRWKTPCAAAPNAGGRDAGDTATVADPDAADGGDAKPDWQTELGPMLTRIAARLNQLIKLIGQLKERYVSACKVHNIMV